MAERILVIVDDEKEIADVMELYLKNDRLRGAQVLYMERSTLAVSGKRRTGSGHSGRDAPGH